MLLDNRNQSKGLHYEALAKTYLITQGLQFLQQNYRSRFGEIDLIMSDADVICFVEVKFRKRLDFGGAAYAVPSLKREKIIKTAQFFISENRKLACRAMRFDVLALQQRTGDLSINWIKNAFYGDAS